MQGKRRAVCTLHNLQVNFLYIDGSRWGRCPPHFGPKIFIFMQILEKIVYVHLSWRMPPYIWKILDPPLLSFPYVNFYAWLESKRSRVRTPDSDPKNWPWSNKNIFKIFSIHVLWNQENCYLFVVKCTTQVTRPTTEIYIFYSFVYLACFTCTDNVDAWILEWHKPTMLVRVCTFTLV